MTYEQLITKIKTSRLEHFGAVFLNEHGARVGHTEATSGSQDYVTINVPKLLQAAIDVGARAMVLMHSHPSSIEPRPSEEDLVITTEINRRSTEIIGVPVVDHIIFGARDSKFSFAENGVTI